METILKLEYSLDMGDLKKYLKEMGYVNIIDLKIGIIDYFENEYGMPITDFNNCEEILTKLIDILQ